MKTITIRESERSEEVRQGLREQGFRQYWDVTDERTRISYFSNGSGKAILLLEHASNHSGDGRPAWESWDMYRPLTSSNKIADTYAALEEYAKNTD